MGRIKVFAERDFTRSRTAPLSPPVNINYQKAFGHGWMLFYIITSVALRIEHIGIAESDYILKHLDTLLYGRRRFNRHRGMQIA